MMPTRIVELSALIAEKTKIVDDYFTKNGLPTPSFALDGPPRIQIPPTEQKVAAAHIAVLDATKELNQLLTGPGAVLMGMSTNDCLSLHAIYHYKIAQSFPAGQERTFEEVSAAVGLNVIDLRRLLRHAMCNRIFCEPRAGVVAHTAASKLLAENKLMYGFAGITVEESFASAPRVIESLDKYGGAHDPRETAFTLANNTNVNFYEYMSAHPERGNRWASAMNAFAATVPLQGLLATFPFSSLPPNSTLVDVGGAWGPVSVAIAQSFSNISRFIVQDLPDVVAEGPNKIPANVRERFEFMAYDILTPQPVEGAEVYFFRAIFHNWPDKSCVEILRNQIPALKKGARVVVQDGCLHEPGSLPMTVEKRRRSMDLSMLTYFGSRERTVDDWREILAGTDPRFVLRSATLPPGDMNWLLDIEWTG